VGLPPAHRVLTASFVPENAQSAFGGKARESFSLGSRYCSRDT
jgi:hypothetical protein